MCLLHAFVHCLFDSILSWFLYYTLFFFPFKAFISSLTRLDPVSTQESLIFFEGVLNSTTNYSQLLSYLIYTRVVIYILFGFVKA